MSSPDRPETPEHEKLQQKHSAAMGRRGAALAHRVGDKFVADNLRSGHSDSRARKNADAAVVQREAWKKSGPSAVQTAKTGADVAVASGRDLVTGAGQASGIKAQTNSASTRAGVNAARSNNRSLGVISSIENTRALDKMNRQFSKINSIVDTAGAVATLAMPDYSTEILTGAGEAAAKGVAKGAAKGAASGIASGFKFPT